MIHYRIYYLVDLIMEVHRNNIIVHITLNALPVIYKKIKLVGDYSRPIIGIFERLS
jgi:hypothetical protein